MKNSTISIFAQMLNESKNQPQIMEQAQEAIIAKKTPEVKAMVKALQATLKALCMFNNKANNQEINQIQATLYALNNYLRAQEKAVLFAPMFEAHQLYISSGGKQGAKIKRQINFAFDFSFMDLRNFDFSGLDLQGCSFEGANLAGANFSDTLLYCANFEGAIVTDANFKGAEGNILNKLVTV